MVNRTTCSYCIFSDMGLLQLPSQSLQLLLSYHGHHESANVFGVLSNEFHSARGIDRKVCWGTAIESFSSLVPLVCSRRSAKGVQEVQSGVCTRKEYGGLELKKCLISGQMKDSLSDLSNEGFSVGFILSGSGHQGGWGKEGGIKCVLAGVLCTLSVLVGVISASGVLASVISVF